jgi:hypothetical protein
MRDDEDRNRAVIQLLATLEAARIAAERRRAEAEARFYASGTRATMEGAVPQAALRRLMLRCGD